MKHVKLTATFFCLSGAMAQAQTRSQVFIATTQNTVILLQWTEATGQLKGSAQVVTVTPQPLNIGLNVLNSGLSGTRSGADYSLVFDKPVLGKGVSSAPASIVKDQLLINIPSESGGLSTITLNRSTLQLFNDAVTNLKAYGAKESARLQNQDSIIAASQPVENALYNIRSYFDDVEKAVIPDTRKVDVASRALTTYTNRLTAADQAGNCALVTTLVDGSSDPVDALQTAIDEASASAGRTPTAFVSLGNFRANYDTALAKLRAVSSADADSYAQANAALIKRVDQTTAKNKPAFLVVQSTLDTATDQLQKFNVVVGGLACK